MKIKTMKINKTMILASLCIFWGGLAMPLAQAETPQTTTPPSAIDWFEKMMQSTKERNYRGRFVYHNQKEMRSVDIVHAYKDQEYEKLEHLSGTPYHIIRRGKELFCAGQSGTWMEIHQGELPNDVSFLKTTQPVKKLAEFYQISQTGEHRIAGREAVIIELNPKDKHRYLHRFSIDQKTSLMLKYDIYDAEQPKKKPLESLEYVSIEVDQPFDERLFSAPPKVVKLPPEPNSPSTEKTTKQAPWKVTWVPAGFDRIETMTPPHEKTTHEGQSEILFNQAYSDGLSMFSIFIQKRPDLKKNKIKRMGVSTIVEWAYEEEESVWITVVGDLPANTAVKIASSIESPTGTKSKTE
jgi:sigma-E factor negative regulatory protein RseB